MNECGKSNIKWKWFEKFGNVHIKCFVKNPKIILISKNGNLIVKFALNGSLLCANFTCRSKYWFYGWKLHLRSQFGFNWVEFVKSFITATCNLYVTETRTFRISGTCPWQSEWQSICVGYWWWRSSTGQVSGTGVKKCFFFSRDACYLQWWATS